MLWRQPGIYLAFYLFMSRLFFRASIRHLGIAFVTILFLAASFVSGTGGCGSSGSEVASADDLPSAFEDGNGEIGEDSGETFEVLEVVSTAPAAAETDVSLLAEITVTFNRTLSEGEVASALLSVSIGGVPVDGAVSFEENNTRIVFTPAAMLERGGSYAATLSLEPEEAGKAVFEGQLSWDFTVDAAYYVSPSGDDSSEGIREFPWKSIQYTVDTVPAGATVRLLEGTFGEDQTILVSKSLSLKGEGRNATRIGPPNVVGAGFIDQTIFDIAGADDGDPENIEVTIEGMTIDAEETSGLKFGMLLRGGAYAVVRNCTLKGAMEFQGSVNSGNIAVGWNDYGYTAHALIEGNLLTDFHSFGIAVYGTGNEAVIRNNEIVGNASMHICSSNPGNWAGAMGIVIQRNESATVEGNTITGMRSNSSCDAASYDAGIETYWPGAMEIRDNVIEDNDYGFASYASMGSVAALVIDENDILANDVGVQLGNVNVLSVRENNFEGNAVAGVRNTVATSVDASGNYWGAADGPNPPGSGDPVDGNLVVVPFSAMPY